MIRKHLPAKWLVILFLAVTLPQDMMAQFNFDFETVEALIRDHKRIRSVLMVRDGIEHANEVLHQYSKKSVDKHYEINVDLDEFTRLFDVLDLMANSATTVINAVDTEAVAPWQYHARRHHHYQRWLQGCRAHL